MKLFYIYLFTAILYQRQHICSISQVVVARPNKQMGKDHYNWGHWHLWTNYLPLLCAYVWDFLFGILLIGSIFPVQPFHILRHGHRFYTLSLKFLILFCLGVLLIEQCLTSSNRNMSESYPGLYRDHHLWSLGRESIWFPYNLKHRTWNLSCF